LGTKYLRLDLQALSPEVYFIHLAGYRSLNNKQSILEIDELSVEVIFL